MEEHFEIERKFLIQYPDLSLLLRQPLCRVAEIEQTYLTNANGGESRVRLWRENGQTVYYKTEKEKVGALRRIEREAEISEEEYKSLLTLADPAKRPLQKTRYRIPYQGSLLEIDVYPFWSDQAILEIELSNENDPISVPPYLQVIREVSGEAAYKNKTLASRKLL